MTPARTLDELERNVEAWNHLQEIIERVKQDRAALLRKYPRAPRPQCPGCFSAIYDLCRKQGWCVDCSPRRKEFGG